MIITIKNLQQQTFQVEFDPSETVLKLKQKIEAERGKEYPTESQKLIYAGMILSDDKTIASYNFDEKKFIVVMVNKVVKKDVKTDETSSGAASTTSTTASSTPAAEAKSDAASATSTDVKTETKAESATSDKTTPSENTPSTPTNPAGTPTPASAQIAAESALLMGDEYSRMVSNIMEMGYSREMVEYLLSGIPDGGNLEELNNDRLAAGGEDGGAGNINIPAGAEAAAAAAAATGGAGTPASGDRSSSGGDATLYLTPQDHDAIERLKGLGFPEHLVLQAYFACEKNENLAANFLLSSNLDD